MKPQAIPIKFLIKQLTPISGEIRVCSIPAIEIFKKKRKDTKIMENLIKERKVLEKRLLEINKKIEKEETKTKLIKSR